MSTCIVGRKSITSRSHDPIRDRGKLPVTSTEGVQRRPASTRLGRDNGYSRSLSLSLSLSMDAVSNRNNAGGGGDSFGGDAGRTKVMDGSWNPRRVNCWPLHVRLGDTLALPWSRKSMHPFVFSRALLDCSPVLSLSLPPPTHRHQHTLASTSRPTPPSFSTCSLATAAVLSFAPARGVS